MPEIQYPIGLDLASELRQAVTKFRDRPAIVDRQAAVSYGDVWASVTPVAEFISHLFSNDLEPRIGILAENRSSFIIAVLSAVLAGGAYVPLTAELPPPRLQAMAELANIRCVIVDSEAMARTAESCGRPVYVLDRIQSSPLSMGPFPKRSSGQLACVLFTSGSTGSPKAVAVEDGNILHLARNTPYAPLGPDTAVGQAANPLFDAFTFELWCSLLNGCRLVVLDTSVLPTIGAQLADMSNGCNTVAFLTTALVNRFSVSMPRSLNGIDTLLFGGELGTVATVKRLAAAEFAGALVNMYGPTEATTFTTWWPIDVETLPRDGIGLPIGSPIPGADVLLLDSERRPVRDGEIGEIYISGNGVARGYLDQPALTRESFVWLEDEQPRRVYRSGDLGVTVNDVLSWNGRIDNQIKRRGHRIDPAEVEAHMLRCGLLESAVVLAQRSPDHDPELVAFGVPLGNSTSLIEGSNSSLIATKVMAYLRGVLPPYMLPQRMVIRDSLPLGSTGKIDRQLISREDHGGNAEVLRDGDQA